MKEVGGLVPVNPHTAKVVAKEVVERVARKEAQAVRNPICFIRIVVKVGFGPLPEVTNRLCALLVCTRPDAQSNTVERVT